MQNDRKINGRDIENVEKALREPFDKTQIEHTKDSKSRPYFPKEVYYERLDSTISNNNYKFVITQSPTPLKVGDSTGFSCTCELRVFDDKGKEVIELFSSGIGYYDVIFFEGSTKPKSLEENMLSSLTRAKKHAVRTLLGNIAYASHYTDDSSNTSQENVQELTQIMKLTKSFNETGNRYVATAQFNEAPIELIIWKNNMLSINDEALALLKSQDAVGKEILFSGTPSSFQGKNQFFVRKVAKRNGGQKSA